MPDEPLFDGREQPGGGDGLPPELKGKSPKEIVDFFKAREATLVNEANTRIAAAAAQPPKTPVVEKPKAPDSRDFWTDPSKAVKDQIAASTVSREEFERASASVQSNMIEMSEFLVAQKFPDWKLFKPMIDEIMLKCDPWAKTDKTMWESAYYYARGRNPDLIPKVTAPPTVIVPGAERGAAGPLKAPAPEPTLSTDEQWVADRLGISPADYTDAKTKMSQIGSLPFTYDNRAIAPAGRK